MNIAEMTAWFSGVSLPLATPGLAIVGILAFNYHWNEFFRPLMAERERIYPSATHSAEWLPPVSWHLAALRRIPFVEIVGLYDVDPARAAASPGPIAANRAWSAVEKKSPCGWPAAWRA
mgnify:CR=1 FL=1